MVDGLLKFRKGIEFHDSAILFFEIKINLGLQCHITGGPDVLLVKLIYKQQSRICM